MKFAESKPEPNEPKTTADRAAVIASAVNKEGRKNRGLGDGWFSYMRITIIELLEQGYTITDPEGKEYKKDA